MPTGMLGVGLVGYSFMGAAHSQAWRTVGRFFDLPLGAEMTALCGRDADRARAAAARYGWRDVETDWRRLLERDDIDVIDICTPGDSHAEIAIAALGAGKHVICEKPLANTVEDAVAMAAAARAAAGRGIRSLCGFTYRRVPAVTLMAEMVAGGAVGTLRHVRASYLQDWLVDEKVPMSWRLDAARAGSGALGDIGAHIVDMAQYVTGQRIAGLAAVAETFVRHRPQPAGEGFLGAGGTEENGTDELGEVTVDDAVAFVARTGDGALATFEASRFGTGHKNGLRLELNGSRGSLAFDLERMNELSYYDATREPTGFTTILVTEPNHPYIAAWWPPGHTLGYEHAFTHQARDFLAAIADGVDPRPSFTEGLAVQRVLAAAADSAAAGGCWVGLEPESEPAEEPS